MRSSFLRTSLVAQLLRDRTSSAIIAGAGFSQLVLSSTPIHGFSCPQLRLTGIPCAGCGLTRSIQQILAGHFLAATELHLFGPVALGVLLLFGAAVFMTPTTRGQLADHIERIERRTAITPILLGAMFVYWLVRLWFMHGGYVQLMRG